MEDYKIILSPAKIMDESPNRSSYQHSIPSFQGQSEKLINKLKRLEEAEIGALMSLSPSLQELNKNRFQAWKTSRGEEEELVSIMTFKGEVYRAFEFETLSKDLYAKLDQKLRILSGLYGVLSPFDLIRPYRLEMGTKLSISSKEKNLYDFWKKSLLTYFKDYLKDAVLINLASNEYFKAIDVKNLKNRVITPHFKEFKNRKYQTIMMYAKNARGKMARYLIENELSSIEEMKLFNLDGYQFDANLSNVNDWVFTR